MRRLTGFLALAAVACSSTSAVAQQNAALPTCPNKEDNLTTYTPGYGKPGESGVYQMDLAFSNVEASSVTNLTITLSTESGQTTVTPVQMRGESTKAIIAAPTSGSGFVVTFEWDQDVGTAAACRGRDTHKLRLLPTKAKVGDPFASRLEGRYRVRLTPLNYEDEVGRRTWTIRPRCDYFACTGELRSTGGLKGTIRLRDDGTYRLTINHGVGADCEVTKTTTSNVTGEVLSRETYTIRRAYRRETRVSVRVRKTRAGRGVELSGLLTYTAEPTARARSRGCTDTKTYEDRISGRRAG